MFKNIDNEQKYSINKITTEKKVRKNCSIVAGVIIYNLFIAKEDTSLLPLLKTTTAKNNFDAIREWIYKKNPQLTYLDNDIINEYQKELTNYLECSRNYYY